MRKMQCGPSELVNRPLENEHADESKPGLQEGILEGRGRRVQHLAPRRPSQEHGRQQDESPMASRATKFDPSDA